MTITFTTSLHAANTASSRPETFHVGERRALITILSYNVKGLPAVAGVTEDRYADIGVELKKLREQNRQPSIVLLQEAFVGKTKDIDKHAGYKNVARGPAGVTLGEKSLPVIKLLGAGLRVLSDFPITRKSKVAFDAFTCSSWDCLAAKGAQAVEVNVPGIPFPITVANTHAQAGSRSDQVRIKQLNTFWRFLSKFTPTDAPLFAIGDFNSYPSLSCYSHWTKETKLASVSDACVSKEIGCDVTLRFNKSLEFSPDQHFYRSGKINGYDVSIRPVFAEHLFHQPINGRLLSDHWGYNVTYEITWDHAHALASSTN